MIIYIAIFMSFSVMIFTLIYMGWDLSLTIITKKLNIKKRGKIILLSLTALASVLFSWIITTHIQMLMEKPTLNFLETISNHMRVLDILCGGSIIFLSSIMILLFFTGIMDDVSKMTCPNCRKEETGYYGFAVKNVPMIII